MERFSTTGLPSIGRVAAWNELYSTRMSRVEFTPGDHQKFDAELRIGRLGPVRLARLNVDRCSIERSQRHLAQSPRLYSFLLQVKGASTFHHYGHDATLQEGDFVLCYTGMPHYFQTRGSSETLMVRVLPDALAEFLPSPEEYCGLHLGNAVGLAGTAAAMVQSLARKVETGLACDNQEGRVARYLLELISLSYTTAFGSTARGSSAIRQRRLQVLRHIEDHLREPRLTVDSVARALSISPRYLRVIFAGTGEKLSAYVLRRRLEECARQMCSPAWSGHSLMQIASSWGFSSAAHFTRRFREQFEASPREYRRRLAGS